MVTDPALPRADLALLVYDLRGSGVVRNVLRIAAAAAADGLATEIWVIRNDGALAGDVPAGVTVRTLGSPLAAMGRTPGSAAAVGRIADAVISLRPRILFSAGNQIHLFAAAAWRRAGRPAGVHFLGRASNAVVGRGAGWRAAARAVERYQYAPMERIVAVADELRRDLVHHLGVPADRVIAIPNGVDLPPPGPVAPAPHPWLEATQPPVVMGMGRLVRQKNFPLLIEAFAILRAAMPVRLVILGDGPDGDALRALAAKRGLADDVLMPGFVSVPGLWLSRANVFVLSSLWEGSSNALLEALAHGCAIVATDIPSGARTVLAGGHGALVPTDDPGAMAAAMRAALAAPPERLAQRERAAAFSTAEAMRRYLALFRAVLANG